MDPGILSIPGTWDYPGMSLVRVTDSSMDPGILSIPGTWDYSGMSLVRVTDYTAWILEYLAV